MGLFLIATVCVVVILAVVIATSYWIDKDA